MVAGLSLISPLIADNILTPCYFPESATASRTMKEILEQQLNVEPRRENMMRSLILSAYTADEMDAAGQRAVAATLDEVVCQLGPILADGDTFCADLARLLQKFVDVWKPALFSKKFILATAEIDNDVSGWDKMEEFGNTMGPGEAVLGRPKFRMLNLFPRIYVPELAYIIHKGIVLLPWQEVVLDAEREHWDWAIGEARRNKSGRDANGGHTRTLSRRERRSSIAAASRNSGME
jgi:hypothetical protein